MDPFDQIVLGWLGVCFLAAEALGTVCLQGSTKLLGIAAAWICALASQNLECTMNALGLFFFSCFLVN